MTDNKYAFDLISARKEKIERKLLKNLVLQLVCIVIGLSFVYHYDILIAKTVKGYVKADTQLVQIVIPLFLIYLFIEFGYAFGQFLFINRTYKYLFDLIFEDFQIERDQISRTDLTISFESLNLFGQIQAENESWQGKAQTFISMAAISSVLLAGHFTAYSLVENLISSPLYVVLVKCMIAAFLVPFYWSFYTSNRTFNLTSQKLTAAVAIVAGVFSIYTILDSLQNWIFPSWG
ncbi:MULTISPECIES: hypothetical protein [unclassified Flavobacterium]|uniref:hypothetical protein n=1 Tax=unclassified Flavobacterium TaxID=196869 RepID=UPI001F13C6FE|nr:MULTISPECIES: hypothetical protein [unclassified Flavobacterium]UMY64917.1 hypothetical protein MKO97_10370 [Flavobacterium sp. HJ-32-4]